MSSLGETLVQVAVIAVTGFISFLTFLYLWNWALNKPANSDTVACMLPFILACVCALVLILLLVAPCGVRPTATASP